jgi:Zn-dependent protease
MALPAMSSSRSLLSFRLAGIPVRVDITFLFLVVLYGFTGSRTVVDVAVFVLIAGASILLHEMGHALIARQAGASPVIELHGMGGLTSWSGGHPVSRSRMIAISLAGPLAGVALGLALMQLRDSGALDLGRRGIYLDFAVFANLGWGVLNLLPILPLDGGQVMRDLLPGDEARRTRLAAGVSVVTGAVMAVVALTYGFVFAALFAAFFAFTNFTSLRAPRPARRPVEHEQLQHAGELAAAGDLAGAAALATGLADAALDRDVARAAAHLAAECLLLLDRPGEARDVLLDLPVGTVDPVLEGAVLAATGHAGIGIQRLQAAYAGAPDERSAYRLAEALARNGRQGEVAAAIGSAGRPAPDVVRAAASGAEAGGADERVTAALRADAAGG